MANLIPFSLAYTLGMLRDIGERLWNPKYLGFES